MRSKPMLSSLIFLLSTVGLCTISLPLRAETSFEACLKPLIARIGSSPDDAKIQVFRDICALLEDRTTIHEPGADEVPLTPTERSLIANQLAHQALLSTRTENGILAAEAYAVVGLCLGFARTEMNPEVKRLVRQEIISTTLNQDPTHVRKAKAAATLLRYFTPYDLDTAHAFLQRALAPDCDLQLAGRLFGNVLSGTRHHPESIANVKAALRSAAGVKKCEFIKTFDGFLPYDCPKDFFAVHFETTIIECMGDSDRSVQATALDKLNNSFSRYGYSETGLDAVIVLALDRHRSVDIRTRATYYLGIAHRKTKWPLMLETMAFIANDKSDVPAVRVNALKNWVSRQPDGPDVRAFVDRFREETGPSIVEVVREYDGRAQAQRQVQR